MDSALTLKRVEYKAKISMSRLPRKVKIVILGLPRHKNKNNLQLPCKIASIVSLVDADSIEVLLIRKDYFLFDVRKLIYIFAWRDKQVKNNFHLLILTI